MQTPHVTNWNICAVPNGEHWGEVYRTQTTEKDLPSLKEKESKGHKMPFNPSQQSAKNTGVLLLCCNCIRPRLLHSKLKLKPEESRWLDGLFEEKIYICGSNIQDIDIDDTMIGIRGKDVQARSVLSEYLLSWILFVIQASSCYTILLDIGMFVFIAVIARISKL